MSIFGEAAIIASGWLAFLLIAILAMRIQERFEAVAKQFGKWPRDPAWSATGNPSLISWGPSYRESLLFVFRGGLNAPGLQLANIMAYVNPNADCVTAALSPTLRDAKFEGSEADAIIATISELMVEGTVEEENGCFRLTKKGFSDVLLQRRQIEALSKANADKMAEIKSRPVPPEQVRE